MTCRIGDLDAIGAREAEAKEAIALEERRTGQEQVVLKVEAFDLNLPQASVLTEIGDRAVEVANVVELSV